MTEWRRRVAATRVLEAFADRTTGMTGTPGTEGSTRAFTSLHGGSRLASLARLARPGSLAIAQVLGHSSYKMTGDLYGHLRDEAMAARAAQVGEFYARLGLLPHGRVAKGA